MKIKSLDIQTGDLAGTRYFYETILGLEASGVSHQQVSYFLQHSRLTFHAVEGQQPIYHLAFNIPSNQVHEAAHWLQGKAEIPLLENGEAIADFSNWNAKAVYFFDNNGNILELIARDDLDNASGKSFDAHSLLSVSEVGLVTGDVQQACDHLIQKFGLGYFSKQPPLQNFAALGDDEGLFIVVSNNRHWYPTEIRSSQHWFRAVMESGGGERVYEYHP